MPAKRPRIRKDGQRDNRSRPILIPCPPEHQRYILRRVGKKGLGKIVAKWPEGNKPSVDAIYHYLHKRGWVKCTYILMSTRPRPKHVMTCWWELNKKENMLYFKHREGS